MIRLQQGVKVKGCRVRLVTFDATNTLMQLRAPVGQQYLRLLLQNVEPSIAVDVMQSSVTAEAIETAFATAYKARAAEFA